MWRRSDPLNLARELILRPSGLDDRRLDQVFGQVLAHSVDFADLYFQLSHEESWSLEDGIVKDGSASIEQGVGVRAIAGEKTGFAYSDEIMLPALEEASRAARAIAVQGADRQAERLARQGRAPAVSAGRSAATALRDADKVAWLERVDRESAQARSARRAGDGERGGRARDGAHRHQRWASSPRTCGPLVRFNVSVHRRAGRPARAGLRRLRRPLLARGAGGGRPPARSSPARRCARRLVNLEAKPAPAGTMTVVLGPGWPGILLHEAIGHGLEGDFNRKGTSAFAGRIGERSRPPSCTVVDDGTLSRRRGSLNIDDEGTPTQCTTLIENGMLKGYMQDKTQCAPHGRRAHRQRPARVLRASDAAAHDQHLHAPRPACSRGHHPLGRQTGIYAVNFGGGQVDITSGKFVFSASEAYAIENGKRRRAAQGRDADRQRARCAHARPHGRQ